MSDRIAKAKSYYVVGLRWVILLLSDNYHEWSNIHALFIKTFAPEGSVQDRMVHNFWDLYTCVTYGKEW
jgi:hypothetical protein